MASEHSVLTVKNVDYAEPVQDTFVDVQMSDDLDGKQENVVETKDEQVLKLERVSIPIESVAEVWVKE